MFLSGAHSLNASHSFCVGGAALQKKKGQRKREKGKKKKSAGTDWFRVGLTLIGSCEDSIAARVRVRVG